MKRFGAVLVMAALSFAIWLGDRPAVARGGGGHGRQVESHASECKASIRVKGSGNMMRRLARQSAISSWSKEVEAAAGAQYSNWDHAKFKSVSCKSTGRVTVRCVARGRPCKK